MVCAFSGSAVRAVCQRLAAVTAAVVMMATMAA